MLPGLKPVPDHTRNPLNKFNSYGNSDIKKLSSMKARNINRYNSMYETPYKILKVLVRRSLATFAVLLDPITLSAACNDPEGKCC